MLSLPPHTSHRMEPLDLTFFGPLKAIYKKECDLFLKNRLVEKITPYDVAAIFNRAYSTVASINKGESGFRAAGIVPYNPDHFTEEDFIVAEVLTQPAVIVQDSSMVIPASTSVNPMTATSSDAIIPAPSTSSATIDTVLSTPPATMPSTSSATIDPVLSTPPATMPSTSSATIDPVPLTSSATTRLLTSPTVMNATPSTSSGNIQSNIANLLPFPTQTNKQTLQLYNISID
uniref:DDE-1 domain-containing protein n=1 Tax=Heliothis virescens TaxID=7102 RepID=A0A2A4IY81_HELVI